MKWWFSGLLLLVACQVRAQAEGGAIFVAGVVVTDVGEDKGNPDLMYGLGLGGSYGFFRDASLQLVIGGDLLVHGFALDVPGRIERSAGVFDQSDLLLDQFVGLQIRRVMVGGYFEQRRIDRGTPLGNIGFPASGTGVIGRVWLDAHQRAQARVTYATFSRGELQLQGTDVVSMIESGSSLRLSVRAAFGARWGLRGEFVETKIEFQPVAPTFGLFDHRQRSMSAGLVLLF